MNTVRSIGVARIAIMAVVALCLLGFFGVLMTRMSTPSMALLYNDISVSDAGAIGQKLDALKIPFQVSPEGTTIRVPNDQVGRARMALAQDGLPKGGSVGYEVFDQNQGFGTTSFMQNLNQVRALEGELARTVSSLAPVHNARIHLVLPKRELFSRDEQPATASVVLQLRPGAQLSHEQVSAIRHLIASAVPQLKPGQVSIIDDHGNLLAKPDDANGADDQAANNDEQQHAYETRLAHQIEALVGRTVGDGHVRATVTADMDFDRITTSQESYDPDQQVVRSTQATNEKNDSQDTSSDKTVSVQNNLPGSSSGGGGGNSTSSKNSRSEETTNYEIGKTTRNQVREGGQVRKLAIAVLVDGTYETDKDGKQTYQPRSKEEMTQIENIVRSSTGYDAKRGDVIDVANMRFATDPELGTPAIETGGIMGFAKSDLIHLAETGLIALVALLVALLVIRPMLTRLASGPVAGVNPNFAAAGLIGGSQAPALSAPTSGNVEAMGMSATMTDFGNEDAINFDQVEGRVRASSLKKIGEIVDKHPSEAVSIIRGWMYQEKAT
jgi:flagellar M-ring protein FliF